MTKNELERSLYIYRAKCFRVVDGDTLDLDIDLGLNIHDRCRVRLYGIDTPETYGVKKDSAEYAAGLKAKDRVVWLLKPETPVDLWVETHKDQTEKYGRYLASVWFWMGEGVVSLNDLLVSEGLAEKKDY